MEEYAELYEQALLSEELLHSVYTFPAALEGHQHAEYQRVLKLHPELVEKLTRKFPDHPTLEVSWNKAEQQLLECIKDDALKLAQDLQPAYDLLQRVARFQRRCERLLADLNQKMLPLTASVSPHLIQAYMETFCNCVRIAMLMRRAPWRTLMQLYTVCAQALLQKDPRGRSSLNDFIVSCETPVAMLQARFQPITDRIKQVLEVMITPTLQTACWADTLIRTSLFDVGRMETNQMGVAGLSKESSYNFLQNAEMYRQWALLGFLVCPRALHGAGAKVLLEVLLQESFILPVYQEVTENLYSLFTQLEPYNCGVSSSWLSEVWEAAQAGSATEHKLRRLFITRCLEDMANFMEDEPSFQLSQLEMLLAASAFGRAELLWYMRHVGEQVPVPGKVTLPLFQQNAVEVVQSDSQVLQLLAALVRVYEGLARFSPAIRAHHQELMKAVLDKELTQSTDNICKYAQQGLGEGLQLAGRGGRPRNTGPAPAALQALRELVPKLQTVTTAFVDLAHTTVGSVEEPAPASPGGMSEPPSPLRRPSTSGTPAAGSPTRRQSLQNPTVRGASGGAAGGAAAGQQEGPGAAGVSGPEGTATPVLASPQKTATPQRAGRTSIASEDAAALAGVLEAAAAAAADFGDCPLRESILREWLCVVGFITTTGSPLRSAQLEMPAQNPRYISAINKMLEVYPFVTSPLDAIARYCSLEELALHEPKVEALLGRVLAASSPDEVAALQGCMACIKALHWYGIVRPVPGQDFEARARDRAMRVLKLTSNALKMLVREMVQENELTLPMVEAPLPPAPPLNLNKTQSYQHLSQQKAGCKQGARDRDTADTDTALSRDTQQQLLISASSSTAPFAAATGMQPSSQLRLLRAGAIAGAMDACGWVRLCGQDAVCPWEWLREALRDCVQDLINTAAADQLDLPRPSALSGRLQCALYTISNLQEATSIHLLPEIWCALLLHAQPNRLTGNSHLTPGSLTAAERQQDDDLGTAANDQGSPRIMDLYAGWYLNNVIKDVNGAGVLYAPQLRCFSCVRPELKQLIQGHTSLSELTALLQVFGPYAAQVLASCCEQTMADCLTQVDGQLDALHSILWPVLQKAMAPGDVRGCLPAVQAALEQMDTLAAVLNVSKTIGRCLALRQLLAEALLVAMQLETPLLALLPSAGVSTSSGVLYDPPRHIADVFQLPRPAKKGVGAPVTADPYVVRLLTGNNSHDRYRRWAALPVLLGLSLSSMVAKPSPHDRAARALDNDLHALGAAVQSLALAHQEAANKMLNCGSAFLHGSEGEGAGGASSQAQDMLATFVKVAAAVMYSSPDSPEVRTCKVVLLQGLASDQTDPQQLAAAWIPPSRLWSAMCPSLSSNA